MLLEQLGRIDLNLLIILQVLLEERNGSKAARRLHLSQSAVSKALGRLRDTFNDPLFIRSAYGLEPTGRALALQQQLQPILLSLDNLIQPPEFDPASSEREFVIASMDSAFTLFAPLYLSELKRQAPRIRLRYEEWTENSLTEMSQGQVDIAFAVRENCINSDYRLDTLPGSICQRLLAIDDLTCLVQQHHPALREQEWDLDRYLLRGTGSLDAGPQAGGTGSLPTHRGHRALLRGSAADGDALRHDCDPLQALRAPCYSGLPAVAAPSSHRTGQHFPPADMASAPQ